MALKSTHGVLNDEGIVAKRWQEESHGSDWINTCPVKEVLWQLAPGLGKYKDIND
jgi:hypothetical protein